MKTLHVLSRSLASLLALAAAGYAAGDGNTDAPRKPARAMWVTTEALYNRAEIERLVATAAAYDFDALFVQVRRAGDAYYVSAREPYSRKLEGQPAGFDPLAETVRLGRLFGIEVHAWLNVNYVWPGPDLPAAPTHVARRHPEWISVGRDGRRMTGYSRRDLGRADAEGWYVDPAEKAFADYFAAVAAEVAANYDVDGVHLDFVRYPNYRFGYGEKARRRYMEERGAPDPQLLGFHKLDDGIFRPALGAEGLADRWYDLRQLEWLDWRADQVTRIVAATGKAVAAAKPGVTYSAAVWANPEHAYRYVGQDWVRWYEDGLVDVIIPMTYWGDADKLGALASRLEGCRPGHAGVYLGVGTFNHGELYTAETVAGLAGAPVDGVVLFDYDSCWAKPGVLPALVRTCPKEKPPCP